MNQFRTGHGYDVHQLVPGRKLVIGGVHIPHQKGSLGHSDGDVLIHAICDALLGAAALGDIGQHFPNDDPALKDIDSLIILEKVITMLREKNYSIGNIDSTVILQSPPIKNHIPTMRDNIARTAGIETSDVSVKATTTEHLGFIGEGKGVAAEAVVLIYKC